MEGQREEGLPQLVRRKHLAAPKHQAPRLEGTKALSSRASHPSDCSPSPTLSAERASLSSVPRLRLPPVLSSPCLSYCYVCDDVASSCPQWASHCMATHTQVTPKPIPVQEPCC